MAQGQTHWQPPHKLHCGLFPDHTKLKAQKPSKSQAAANGIGLLGPSTQGSLTFVRTATSKMPMAKHNSLPNPQPGIRAP